MSRLCAGQIVEILIIRKHDIRPHPRLHRPAAGAGETEFSLIGVSPCLVEFIPSNTRLRQNEELPIPPVVQSTSRLIQHPRLVLPSLITKHPAHRFRLQARQIRASHEQRHRRKKNLHFPFLVPILRQQRSDLWGVLYRIIHASLGPVFKIIISLTHQQGRPRIFADDVAQPRFHECRLACADRREINHFFDGRVGNRIHRPTLPRCICHIVARSQTISNHHAIRCPCTRREVGWRSKVAKERNLNPQPVLVL